MSKKTLGYSGNHSYFPLRRLVEEHRFGRLLLVAFLAVLSFASCSDDDSLVPDTHTDETGQPVTLTLSAESPTLGSANSNGTLTRAAVYEDGNDDEMMKSWFILVTRHDSIKYFFTSHDSTTYKQEESLYTRLDPGEYKIYSFANLPIDSLGLTRNSEKLPDNFDSLAVTVNGNQESIAGFPDGIPMSGDTTVTITPTTSRVDLNVVRMVAKMRIRVSNPTNDELKITLISLTDITDNTKNNLKLFAGSLVENDTTGKRHVNLNNAVVSDSTNKSTFIYVVPDDQQTLRAGETRNYEFYVNESRARSSLDHFVVGLQNTYDVATASGDTTITRARYAFGDWNSIARNEIHVLPISLRRYRIEFYVEAFTAIGVYPMFDNEPEIATVNFGLYGHYDIVPRIRDLAYGTYYSIRNTSYSQNETVQWVNSNTVSTDSIKIHSLKLVTDNREMGIPYDRGGWIGSDGKIHYPIVGWNETAARPRVECVVGNYTGWAIYTVNASFTPKGSTTPINITRRFRINNTYLDLSQLSKRHIW